MTKTTRQGLTDRKMSRRALLKAGCRNGGAAGRGATEFPWRRVRADRRTRK